LFVIAFFLALLACGAAYCEVLPRDPDWAGAVEVPGVPNLYRVTEDIYRSAQPTEAGFKNLEDLGIRTVLNLRGFHGDDLRETGLKEIRIRMHAWKPDTDDLARAVRILSDPAGGPYLVHCEHGADRTGMTIAVYRMAVQGWSRDAAIDEMVNGGYGFHKIWAEIPLFLMTVDLDEIREAVEGR
jgi:protein tyrosine/serine phosphatase